jgi:hypothetical protein
MEKQTVRRVDLLKELKMVVKGKKPSIDYQSLANLALTWVEFGFKESARNDAANRGVEELERMFRLEDPRG